MPKLGDFSISGVRVLENKSFEDVRGTFFKVFPSLGIHNFVVQQVNISVNRLTGTVRGLHFQRFPSQETKWITCVGGEVFDVVLDLRLKSPTYGMWSSFHLTPTSGTLVIPPGVAHGFQTLVDETKLMYLHSNHYSPVDSLGINAFDPSLSIPWPNPVSNVSQSDSKWPNLSDMNQENLFFGHQFVD